MTPGSRFLLEKLIVTQLVKISLPPLWNPKVHYHVHKSPPQVPNLRHMHPVHIFPPYFPNIHSNIIFSHFSSVPRVLRFFNIFTFRIKLFFYGKALLTPRPTSKLEDYPLSVVRNYLFNIFAATLHTWRPSPPSATFGRAMLW